MIKRLSIYIKEMFPLKVYIPFAFLNHYILFFTIQIWLGATKPILSFYSLIGVVTIIGFMLIMRIFDEFKDVEVDNKLFAERPFPRGAVKKADLVVLLFITLGIVILFNSFKSYTLPFFILALAYGFLTYKWFFFREKISRNLLLALVTHQPLTYLVNIYVVTTAMVQVDNIDWNGHIYWLAFLFFVPVLGWEISRKIKSKGGENDYVTYSKIFGAELATIICLVIHLSFSIGLVWVGMILDFPIWHIIIQAAILLFVLFVHIRFIVKPIDKYLILKKTSEFQSAIATLIYLIYLIMQFGMEWRWF